MAYPHNEQVPSEDPPPYTEIAEGGSVSVEQGANVPARRPQPPPRRKPVSSASRPPSGPPPSRSSRPPSGPPPTHRQSAPPRTYYEMVNDSQGRSKPRPSGHNQNTRLPPSPLDRANAPPSGRSQSVVRPQARPQLPDKHLRYPPNYYCPKCGNTGIKIRKGTPCSDCYKAFGVPNPVRMIPGNVRPAFPVPPRVLPPGHPGIGGKLCGRCRGSGMISEMLLFESTCPICHGVGRVF